MIIGVCGFGSSGSSAVTDYLKEFSTTEVLDNIEFQLVTYPDGIESLDYYLNSNISKYASSDVALNRFQMYTKRLALSFDRETHGEFTRLTEEYISAITQISWRGYGDTDNSLFNSFTYRNIGNRLMRARVIPLLEKIFKKQIDCYPVRDILFSVHPDRFDEITKNYINAIMHAMGMTNKIAVLNQPFAGNDPAKSFKYFDDPKAIVVDRDPRDMYVFTKRFLLSAGRSIPSDKVETFVTYYRNLRKGMPYHSSEKVLKIQFESMVYDYDKTTDIICDFCGIDKKDRTNNIFVPERSANNTRVFEKYEGYDEDIKFIEDELEEYLFPFDQYHRIETKGGMFYGRSELNNGRK